MLHLKKKNYKFKCSESKGGTIIYNIKFLNVSSYSIDVNEINRYLKILSQNYEFIDNSIINKKIVEYIEFIEIMQYNHQILKAKEQLMILIWNNLNEVFKNLEIISFFKKNMDKMEDLKYYYFIFSNLIEIEPCIEINKSYTLSEYDWELDNIGHDEGNFPEESFILDFIIR